MKTVCSYIVCVCVLMAVADKTVFISPPLLTARHILFSHSCSHHRQFNTRSQICDHRNWLHLDYWYGVGVHSIINYIFHEICRKLYPWIAIFREDLL